MSDSVPFRAADDMKALPEPVQSLLNAFHSAGPPRVWSLIVTAFGDMVGDARTSLPLGALTALLALAQIDAGSVRTALSRLVANGILERAKQGRSSFYLPASRQRAAFRSAAGLIYGQTLPQPSGLLQLMAILANGGEAATKAALEAQGFRSLQPRLMVRPQHDGMAFLPVADTVAFLAPAGFEHCALLGNAFELERLAAGYRSFIALHSPLAADCPREPSSAAFARLMLVHAFRRLVLRDPFLPAVALPADWPASQARALFDQLHDALSPIAAPWLMAHGFPAKAAR
jgi:phenylacetic acid degradation operon negative regulatory protein